MEKQMEEIQQKQFILCSIWFVNLCLMRYLMCSRHYHLFAESVIYFLFRSSLVCIEAVGMFLTS